MKNRRWILGGLILFTLGIGVFSSLIFADEAKNPARICSSCGFGSKKENCVKCNKWCPSNYSKARLCSSCGFGSKKNHCVKCGKYTK